MNVTISNVPDPRSRLYLNGAAPGAVLPRLTRVPGSRNEHHLHQLCRQLNIGVVGGRDGLPHLQHVAVYVAEALDELDAATPATH
jgi:hypothetical protein